MISPQEYDIVRNIAVEVGERALRHFNNRDNLSIDAKTGHDFVTEADLEVEKLLCKRLTEVFPEDGILGEEGASKRGSSGRIWIIDPIDGTTNFACGSNKWGISIGCFDSIRKKPILGAVNFPAQHKLLIGGEGVPPTLNGEPLEKLKPVGLKAMIVGLGLGVGPNDRAITLFETINNEAGLLNRNFACGTASLLEVVECKLDGYVSIAESSWDVMGMLAIMEALGGVSDVDWQKVDLSKKFSIVCGHEGLVKYVSGFVPPH